MRLRARPGRPVAAGHERAQAGAMSTTMPRAATCSMARAEGRASDSVDDQVEVTREGRDDVGGPETAEELSGCGGVAHECRDMSAALAGELDRDPRDAAGRARDQYAPAEYEAGDLERPAAPSSRRWGAWWLARRAEDGSGELSGQVGNEGGVKGLAHDAVSFRTMGVRVKSDEPGRCHRTATRAKRGARADWVGAG